MSPLLTNGSYSKYIHLQSTEPCLVKTHFQFNNFSRINRISLLSSCLTFRIGELEFTELPLKLTLHPEVVPTVPNRLTTVLLESRINEEVNIGNFITMIPDPNSLYPNLQSILFADDDDIMCMLPFANITLFNTHIATGVQIAEQGLQFTSSSLSLFDIGTARVTGRGGTDRPWDSLRLMIRVELNEFTNDLTRHINTELKDDVEEALQHIDSANNTYISVTKRVTELENKLMRLKNQLDNIQRSYNTKERRKGDLEEKRDQHETILYHLLETYWNATDKLQGSIESICKIEECDFACTPGIVQGYCYVPVFMIVKKTCSYYEQAIRKVHKLEGKKKTICSYGKSITTTNPIPSTIGGIVSAVTGSPISKIIGGAVSILTTNKKKLSCQPVIVTDYEWVTMTHLATILKQRQCDILTVKEHTTDSCNYNSTCAAYKTDPVCEARNEECYDNRTKIIKSFNEDNKDLLLDIDMRHYHYKKALNDLIDLSLEIAILKLQNISTSEEIKATSLKIQSSKESAQVANASLQSIIASNARIRKVNNVLNDINSIIRINDIFFDTVLETQTPVIVPLQVVYEIIQLKTSHQVRITVDISANEDLVKKTIYDNIHEDIFDNVIGGSSSRRRRNVIRNGTITLVDIFRDNCALQKGIVNYLDEINQSLSAVQGNITDAVTAINITRANETANHVATVEALRSVGTNLSLALLIKERKIYATQMEGLDLVVSEITDTKLSQWRTDLDELHNQTSNLFGQTCHNLVDCLSTSVNNIRKLVSSLKVFNASEMKRVKDAQYTVQKLSNKTSWTVDDIQHVVSKVYQLALDIAEVGYWCATPPVLSVSLFENQLLVPLQTLDIKPYDIKISNIKPSEIKTSDTIKFVGDSLTLACPSSSSRLPVTYLWYKDHKTIPFATSSSLSIPFLTRADSGLYQCEVRNAIGITKSEPTVLKVYKRVTITQEPESVTAVKEDNAYFICKADGYPLPYYQWLYRRSDDNAWSAINGEREGLLNINNASYDNEGQYRCKAMNNYGTVYSRPVLLTVLPGIYSRLSYNYTISFDIPTPTTVQSLKDVFMIAIGDIININVTPVQVTSAFIGNNQLTISFTLFSSNYLKQHGTDSNEAWLNQTIIDLGQLQTSKTALDSYLRNTTHPFTIRTSSSDVYQANANTVISLLVFDCPNGYQFDTSRLLCGKSFTALYYLLLLSQL